MDTTVLERTEDTPDTVTLRVRSSLDIVPGQFIMLGAPIGEGGREVKRSYSVAGVGSDWLEITVRAQPTGFFSKHLFGLSVGDSLQLYGPFGRHFLWKPREHPPDVPLVLIAGGTGIAPFRAMIEAARAAQSTVRGYVIFSVRTGDDILYASQFAAWREAGFSVVVTLTRPRDEDLAAWSGPLGRINTKLLTATLGNDLLAARYYVCGPTPLVVDVQAVLAGAGVPSSQVCVEKYGAIEG